MNSRFIKGISLFLIATIMLCCISLTTPFAEASVIYSGDCGDNLTWQLDSDGLLTISGTGDMYDKCSSSNYKWITNARSVKIEEGVTSIGIQSFRGCDFLSEVEIPSTVKSIGSEAFGSCYNLRNVEMSEGTLIIDAYAFCNCSSLTSICIPNTVTTIGYLAFSNCSNLSSIYIPGSLTTIGDFAFDGCTNLTDVYYEGTAESWNKIDKGNYNSSLNDVNIHYNTETNTIPVTSISINKTSTILNIGDTDTLVATIAPSDATNQNITWSSSDDTVATVNNGVINAIGAGTTNISVTTEDGNYTATCTVTVLDNYSITYDSNGGTNAPESQTKIQNQDIVLSIEIPTREGFIFLGWSTTSDGEVEYSSGDTYSANEDVTLYAVWEEEIKDISVSGISLNKSAISLNIGDSETLIATIEPSNATNQNVAWSSSNEDVAIVSDGTITAIAEGTAYITVISDNGDHSASCAVTVVDNSSNVHTTTLKYRYREKEYSTSRTELSEPWTLYNTTTEYEHSDFRTVVLKATENIDSSYCTHGREYVIKYLNQYGNAFYLSTDELVDYTSRNPAPTPANDGAYYRYKYCTLKTPYTLYHYYTWGDWSDWSYSQPTESEDIEVETKSVAIVTITFDANGGNNAPSPMFKELGETISLTTDIPNRNDYHFLGWSTSPNGAVEYSTGNEYSADEDITLYAIWEAENTNVNVQAVSLNKGSISLNIGDTETLVANTTPDDATNKNVIWSTSNENVVSVSNGIVTAIGAGTADVTVTTEDGNYSAICAVTVVEKIGSEEPDIPKENSPTLTVEKVTGKAGSTVTVDISISNNPGIAGMMLKLDYDDGLVLSDLTPHIGKDDSALEKLNFTKPGDLTQKPLTLPWDGMDADDTNGKVLTMTFTIPENAENGKVFDISVSYDTGGIYDFDLNDIDFEIINGSVTVKNYTLGDINDDGIFNTKDITILRRGVAGGYGVTLNESADLNNDGIFNTKDITILRRYIAGGYGVTLGQ